MRQRLDVREETAVKRRTSHLTERKKWLIWFHTAFLCLCLVPHVFTLRQQYVISDHRTHLAILVASSWDFRLSRLWRDVVMSKGMREEENMETPDMGLQTLSRRQQKCEDEKSPEGRLSPFPFRQEIAMDVRHFFLVFSIPGSSYCSVWWEGNKLLRLQDSRNSCTGCWGKTVYPPLLPVLLSVIVSE